MPPRRAMHMVFGAIDKVTALLGATKPVSWLTIDSNSSIVTLYQVDGRTYTLDLRPTKESEKSTKQQASETRVPVRGTLTARRSDTDVTLTEVTDPAVKHQVVIA